MKSPTTFLGSDCRCECRCRTLCPSRLQLRRVHRPKAPGWDARPRRVQHFDAKGKQPSMYTIELRKGVSATLPFEDKRDFDEAKKGFIAEPPYQDHGRRRQRRLGHGQLRIGC